MFFLNPDLPAKKFQISFISDYIMFSEASEIPLFQQYNKNIKNKENNIFILSHIFKNVCVHFLFIFKCIIIFLLHFTEDWTLENGTKIKYCTCGFNGLNNGQDLQLKCYFTEILHPCCDQMHSISGQGHSSIIILEWNHHFLVGGVL